VVTVFAKKLSAKNLQQVSQVISAFGFNIESLNRLSGRVHPNDVKTDVKHCLEFGVRGDLGLAQELRKACLSLAAQNNIDIAVQEDNPYRRNRRLVCFDMDSTLIEQEVIDELAKAAGVGEAVSAITEQAMRGELDFDQSFRQRVALLKGLPETALQKVASQLKVSEGAVTLMQTLKKLGYRTAILSGGFVYFAEVLQQLLGIDEVYANHLHIENGLVTGQVVGEIVNGENKAKKLRALAQKHNISLEQVIAVGDGANDLPMLSIAGLGVAFRAKPLVRENAQQAISNVGLDGLLYLLGVRDYDQL
jgi:phosphoserine phosphatase